MDNKTCNKCKTQKPVTEFGKLTKSKDGLNPTCILCMRDYHNDLYHSSSKRQKDIRKNNTKHISKSKEFKKNYLQSHPCLDCGEENIVVLDFDHVCGEKIFDISSGVLKGFSIKRIAEEITKCEVVCANCHRIRTHNRRKQAAVAKSG